MLTRINIGQPITARFLNAAVDQVNQNTAQLNPPRDPDAGVERTGDEIQATNTLTEIGRTEVTERITDPDDENTFIDNKRIETVTMRRGDGSVETWIFQT